MWFVGNQADRPQDVIATCGRDVSGNRDPSLVQSVLFNPRITSKAFAAS